MVLITLRSARTQKHLLQVACVALFEELTCLDLDRRSDDVCTIHEDIDRLHTEKGVVYVCHHHHCYHAEIWRISGIFSSFCFQFACYKGVECVTCCMYSTNLSGRANLEHPWLAVSPCCPTGKHGRHAVSPSNAFNASSLYHMHCIWYTSQHSQNASQIGASFNFTTR